MSKLITRYLHWIGKHHQEKWFDMTRRIVHENFCAVFCEVLCFVKWLLWRTWRTWLYKKKNLSCLYENWLSRRIVSMKIGCQEGFVLQLHGHQRVSLEWIKLGLGLGWEGGKEKHQEYWVIKKQLQLYWFVKCILCTKMCFLLRALIYTNSNNFSPC